MATPFYHLRTGEGIALQAQQPGRSRESAFGLRALTDYSGRLGTATAYEVITRSASPRPTPGSHDSEASDDSGAVEDVPLEVAQSYMLPTCQGPFFVALRVPENDAPRLPVTASLRALDTEYATKAIADLRDVKLALGPQDFRPALTGLLPDQRLIFVPALNKLITLPTIGNLLVMRSLDVETLFRSGRRELLVTSQPPVPVLAGKPYRYPMYVLSKHGEASFELTGGPSGMTVSPQGLISWAVPSGETKEQRVTVAIRNSAGAELTYALLLRPTSLGSKRLWFGPPPDMTWQPRPAVAEIVPTGSSASQATARDALPSPGTESPLQPAGYRIWTDVTGRFRIEADLVSVKDGNVYLRKRTGGAITVPLTQFSEADRKYIDLTEHPGSE